MDGLTEGMEQMIDSTKNFPLPLGATARPDRCLLCGKRKLGFIGGFRPARDTQGLWFDALRPGVTQVRYFALCPRHFRQAKKTQMGNVDEYFKREIVAERATTVH